MIVLLLDLCFWVLNQGPSHINLLILVYTHKPYLPPLLTSYYQFKVEELFIICRKVLGQG